jgi:Protein of unknown function (DUF3293)
MDLPLAGTGLSNLDRVTLERAYLRTSYVARLPFGEVPIRIGQACPQLDTFLATRAIENWAFVSAFNPRSQVLCEQENLARHENLIRAVSGLQFECYDGEGRADDASWPAEKSLLIIGIAPDRAAELSRQFDQHAVVAGAAGSPPYLLWTGSGLGTGSGLV